MPALLATALSISAPQRVVADVWYDFEKFPQWNPLVRSLRAVQSTPDGRPAVGSRLQAELQLSPRHSPMNPNPVVLVCNDEEFQWRGGVPVIMSAKHTFSFHAEDRLDTNSTYFLHTEEFGGLFGAIFLFFFRATLTATFESMNKRLKEVAEKRWADEQARGLSKA